MPARDNIIDVTTIGSVLLTVILTGCTTQATLTIQSQPDGAYVSEAGTGRPWGIAPVLVYYDRGNLTRFRGKDGCYVVKGFEARWVSGIVAKLNAVRLCGSPTGNYVITAARDPSQPGLDKDMQFALQVQATRAQQQQASAASDAALISAWSTLQQSSRLIQCSAVQIGSTVQTQCH